MARFARFTALAVLSWLSAPACRSVLGDVDVGAPTASPATASPGTPAGSPGTPSAEPQRVDPASSAAPARTPSEVPAASAATPLVAAPAAAPAQSAPDAGQEAHAPDAAVPVVDRPIVVDAPIELDRVGVAGGSARLATCRDGVVIGIRPTANPSTDTFGQRYTFIEPICARLDVRRSTTDARNGDAVVTLTEDDSVLDWDDTAPFVGLPPTDVPDPRLIWAQQPAVTCPSPLALVGLSGTYDPVAPDDASTAAVRSLQIECAPLALAEDGIDITATTAGHQIVSEADDFASAGSAQYHSVCPGGRVTTRIEVASGFWLDGFVLGCSSISQPAP